MILLRTWVIDAILISTFTSISISISIFPCLSTLAAEMNCWCYRHTVHTYSLWCRASHSARSGKRLSLCAACATTTWMNSLRTWSTSILSAGSLATAGRWSSSGHYIQNWDHMKICSSMKSAHAGLWTLWNWLHTMISALCLEFSCRQFLGIISNSLNGRLGSNRLRDSLYSKMITGSEIAEDYPIRVDHGHDFNNRSPEHLLDGFARMIN